MNTISTSVPHWREQCENCRRDCEKFELQNVSTSEHLQFIAKFSQCFGFQVRPKGRSVLFERSSDSRN